MVAWRCAPVRPPVFCALVQGLSLAVMRARARGFKAEGLRGAARANPWRSPGRACRLLHFVPASNALSMSAVLGLKRGLRCDLHGVVFTGRFSGCAIA
jgi:hypothetical protein